MLGGIWVRHRCGMSLDTRDALLRPCWKALCDLFHEGGGGGGYAGGVWAWRIRPPAVGPSTADLHVLPMIGANGLGFPRKPPGGGIKYPLFPAGPVLR